MNSLFRKLVFFIGLLFFIYLIIYAINDKDYGESFAWIFLTFMHINYFLKSNK